MKNIILFFLILSNTFVFSQTSEGVNYKNTFNEVNEKPQKNITYKISVCISVRITERQTEKGIVWLSAGRGEP